MLARRSRSRRNLCTISWASSVSLETGQMGTTPSLGFCCEVVKEEGEVVARQAVVVLVVVVVNDKKEVEVVLGQRQAEPDNRLAPANVGVDDGVGGDLVAKVVAWRAREGHVEEAKTSALNPGRTTRYPGVVDTADPPPRALFIVAIDRIPFSIDLSLCLSRCFLSLSLSVFDRIGSDFFLGFGLEKRTCQSCRIEIEWEKTGILFFSIDGSVFWLDLHLNLTLANLTTQPPRTICILRRGIRGRSFLSAAARRRFRVLSDLVLNPTSPSFSTGPPGKRRE